VNGEPRIRLLRLRSPSGTAVTVRSKPSLHVSVLLLKSLLKGHIERQMTGPDPHSPFTPPQPPPPPPPTGDQGGSFYPNHADDSYRSDLSPHTTSASSPPAANR